MQPRERRFALTLSGAHGVSHVFRRLLPPLLPVWAVAFGYPLWQLGLIAGALSLGSGLGQAPMGVLSDRYDRRYILPAGLALVAGSYVALGLVPGGAGPPLRVAGYTATGQFLLMLLATFVGGVGTSVLHPTGYPLISANVREDRKGRVIGAFGSAAKFGDALAPAAVGVLLLGLGWRPILVLVGALGVAYAAGLFVVLGGYDTRPAAAADGAGTDPGDTPDADDAAGPTDRRLYVYPMLAIFLFFAVRMVAAGGVNVFIPEFVRSVYGYSVSAFGVAVTPESTASFYYSALLVTAGVTQLGTGVLVDRFDGRKVLLAHLGAATVVLAALAVLRLSPLALFGVLVLLGASMWGLNPARDALISEITPADREGRSFGYLWTGGLVVGSVSPPLVGYIGEAAGLQAAFGILAGVTVLSAVPIALLLTPRVYRREPEAGPRPGD